MEAVPQVSVVVPTYNYAHFLDEAIQSVLQQSFDDFELIIVDNCSTDNTDAVIEKYLQDPKVRYVKNERNLGLSGNWNRCLDLSRGEFIKFLCADDKFHPDILKQFVDILRQYPSVAIVTNYSDVFGEKTARGTAPFEGLVDGLVMRENLLAPGTVNWLRNPSAVMFRKKDADAVGIFHPKLSHVTDIEYYLRLLSRGDAYFIPQSLSYTRSHGNTQGVQFGKKRYENFFEYYTYMSIVRDTHPGLPGTLRSLVDMRKKQWAIRSAAVMYELLPTLYKSQSRKKFKTALKIGYSEGVLLTPLLKYVRWKYIKKLAGFKTDVANDATGNKASTVPVPVMNEFNTRYPNTKPILWKKYMNGTCTTEFTRNGDKRQVFFKNDGTFLKEELQ